MAQAPPDTGLRLLVLADTHSGASSIPERRSDIGLELVRRACDYATRLGDLDAVLVMGDLVDDGRAEGAAEGAAALCAEVERRGLPLIVVRGNHDGDVPLPGDHEDGPVRRILLNGYQLLVFTDPYDAADNCTRPLEGLQAVTEAAAGMPQAPIIALQHNPIDPPIVCEYPFMHTNRDAVMAGYAEGGVLLSISGHYHPGQPLHEKRGVSYATAPALCEHPFRFLLVRIEGREVTAEEHRLALSADRDRPSAHVDHHCHTQYAYCRDDITAELAVQRSEEFGVGKVYLTEHAGQLYLSNDDYWSSTFLTDPDLYIRERRAGRGRFDEYRRMVEPLRSERVGLGLEVECDGAGRITLLPEDADGWDVIVGAVHVVPGLLSSSPDPAQVTREFMDYTERLIRSSVDILAHPFRLFRRARMPIPTEFFVPVAKLLAECGVAAEINFHTNEEAPEFVAECLRRSVPITFGSDSHGLWEIGALWPHIELLHRAELLAGVDHAETLVLAQGGSPCRTL